MASLAALALRRGTIENRLTALAERVNAQSATPLPPPTYSKVPDIAALERLEYVASLLEQVVGGVAPSTPPTAAEQQLEVTTEIASDLFEQAQEVQDADETGGSPPEREQDPPPPAPTPGPAAQTRRGSR